jgi:nucleoside phosphorylase
MTTSNEPIREARPMKVATAFERVLDELTKARNRFAKFHSAHEGIAVVEEEFLELREVVYGIKWDVATRKQEKEALEMEARQLAAMAIRFMIDVCEEPK